MADHRIGVMTYSGYRGEETPRSILIHNEKIEVVAILNMWIEEGIEDRVRKRFFKVKLPAHRAGLPEPASGEQNVSKGIFVHIVPLDPAYKAGLAGHVPVKGDCL